MSDDFKPCQDLVRFVKDESVPIGYSEYSDEYYLRRGENTILLISHCPFCGGELPPSRRDQFFDELEALGIDFDVFGDKSTLPAPYCNPKWWLKKE